MTERNISATQTLYRVENPNIPSRPDGAVSHEELVGQWFSNDLDTALRYMRKATKISRDTGKPVDGTRLVVAQVPSGELEDFHVSGHPVASQMDVEGDNYLIPRDGSVPIKEVALDPVIAELRGQLGNVSKFSEAKGRVIAYLGGMAELQDPKTNAGE